MFSKSVDLKNNNSNYKKSFWILCLSDYLQSICFKSILINHEITYDIDM